MAGERSAVWSCFTKGPSYSDVLRYDDALGERYEYTSDVINHSNVTAGDVLILRDEDLIHGFGMVDDVTSHQGTKRMARCPSCGKSSPTPRKRELPRYRCLRCGATFDEPVMQDKQVTLYAATYGRTWLRFESPAPRRVLDGLYAGADQQNAIRRLGPDRAREMLTFYGGVDAFLQLQLTRPGDAAPIRGGRVDAVVSRRIGQQQFRDRLLERFGTVCAVTGRQPEEVLDAAHLFTFAERPEHLETAGLILRADVHRLFDRLLLTIEPRRWETRVAPGLLERYPGLAPLDGRPLEVASRVRPDVSYVEQHWASSTGRWKRLQSVS